MGLACSSDVAAVKCPFGDCSMSFCQSSCWTKPEDEPEQLSPRGLSPPTSPEARRRVQAIRQQLEEAAKAAAESQIEQSTHPPMTPLQLASPSAPIDQEEIRLEDIPSPPRLLRQ